MPDTKPATTPQLIRNNEIVTDDWTYLDDAEAIPAEGRVIVSWDRWLRDCKDDPSLDAQRLGIVAPGDTEPETIGPHADRLALVALRVPKFADGRHYSTARLLRERYGFEGELRAIGDVVPDQVFYMHRVGYNAFELPAGPRAQAALAALNTFSVTYQAATRGAPLHRARA